MDEKIEQILLKMNKKLDKILNLQTKIAKTLHLLPVTEKEERDIQITQRKNLAQAANVHDDLDKIQNVPQERYISSLTDLFETDNDIYGDIIDSDFLGGVNNG